MVFFLFALALTPAALAAQERVIDNADLLSYSEIEHLESLIDSIARTYDFELVIVTEHSIGNNSPMEYADDFFDYNDYGLGGDRDGCLFLQVTGSRDYWFSTSGRGIGILNSSAYEKLENDVLRYLREDNYYEAYRAFISCWELFLSLEAQGKSYNFFNENGGLLIFVAWVIALASGFMVVGGWKKSMNTALAQTQAAAYVVSGSLNFKEKKESFLYSTVTKTARPKDTGSGGGVHTSSSGRSHGGGGGKY